MHRCRRSYAVLFVIWLSRCSAFAHSGSINSPSIEPGDFWSMWPFEPIVLACLLLSAWLYARGLYGWWQGGRIGRGIRQCEAVAYTVGWLSLAIALASPVHPLGQFLFSVHMSQHEILMLIAAPLLVLGRPLIVFARAVPTSWAGRIARSMNASVWHSFWRAASNPFVAWLVHALVLWTWHLPALFQATLQNDWVHALQHTSFLGSALLFWWAIIHGRRRTLGYGLAVLYMFTTALHSGLLGALLTFAPRLWYPAYQTTTGSFGLTPLEDQQLGGLIMWVPAGLVYVVAGLALFAGWLRESERRVEKQPAAVPAPAPN